MAYNLRKRSHSQINYSRDGFPIRTLYIHGLPPLLTERALISHFSKYGEVEKYEILLNRLGFRYSIVRFKKAEDAAAAFAHKNHRISKQQLRVSTEKRMYVGFRTYVSSYTASSNENDSINLTGTFLMSLNDDCLMAILSKLQINDLCSLSETCSRLREVAGYVFSTSFQSVVFRALQFTTFHEARRILVNFGPLIDRLFILPTDIIKPYQQLDLLIRYSGDTLRVLRLEDLVVNRTLALKLQKLFPNLTCIAITALNISYMVKSINIFDNCNRLEELYILGVPELQKQVFEMTFPALKRLETGVDCLPNLDFLRSFIARHSHLKELHLYASTTEYSDYVLFAEILNNLKELERLQILCRPSDSVAFRNYLQRLANLQYLKGLYLYVAGQPISTFLNESNSMATMECLILRETIVDDELLTSLIKYKNIRALSLIDVTFVADFRRLILLSQLTWLLIRGNFVVAKWLFELVEKLPKLEHVFFFGASFVVDDAVYLKLVDIVARQANRAPLKIITDCAYIIILRQNYRKNQKFVEIAAGRMPNGLSKPFSYTPICYAE